MANTYDTYKDSGIDWLPQIPQNWMLKRLKDVGYLYGGLTGKSGDDFNVNDEDESYMLFIPFTNIFNNSVINPNQLYKVKVTEGETQNLVKKNDLLFLMSSEDFDGVGKPAIIEDEIDKLGLNSFCKGFRITDNNTSPKYLYYYLSSHISREQVRQEAKGFIRINLRQDKLACSDIMVPTLPEQESIANFLDKKCGEIDSLISLQEEMVSELQAYKQSVITEAVTKGLDSNAKMEDSGVEWIGEIPEDWEIRRIKNIGEAKNGLTYSPANVVDENEGVLVLRSSNIQNGKLCFDNNVFVSCDIPESLWVNKGDLIICSRNGSAALVGKCAMVEDEIKATYGAFMMRFKSTYNHKYIYYLLTCAIAQYKQLFSTTTINQLTVGVFNVLAMPFTKSEIEQQHIVDYLDNKTQQIDSLIALKQEKISELKDYKKSIIYEYVTGKKRVQL